jgi:multidrug efflux pump subunit AcrA (membrane-fusion protein)
LGGATFVFVAQTQQPQPGQPEQPGQPKLVAKQKPVKLGAIQKNNYQVLEGLQPGEKVIISGLQNLSDGAPILPESK